MSYYRDKVALVTGGAAGIGAELVRQLSSAGAVVVIADLAKDASQRLAEELIAHGGRIAVCPYRCLSL